METRTPEFNKNSRVPFLPLKSYAGSSCIDDESETSHDHINKLLRAQNFDPNNVIIHKDDLNAFNEDLDSDEELVFEECGQEEANRAGLENFVSPVDTTIKTAATIVIQRNEEKFFSKNPLLSVFRRKSIIKVPPSKTRETLNDRFHRIQNQKLKRSLTEEQALFNYLRMKGENAFEKTFGHREELMAKLNQKQADRSKAQSKGDKKVVMTDNIIAEIKEATGQDHESFWREQVMNWVTHYEWKRDDRPTFTKEELDIQIEEWMSKKRDFDTTDKMVEDLTNHMKSKGFTLKDSDQLDADMDEYWAKKGQLVAEDPSPTSSHLEKRKIVEDAIRARKSSSMSTVNRSCESSGSSKSLTPFMRARIARGRQRQNMKSDDLDQEMDMYAQRRAQRRALIKQRIKEKEEKEREKNEKARLEMIQLTSGDKFDPDAADFGMDLC
jgi:hypothetical protein